MRSRHLFMLAACMGAYCAREPAPDARQTPPRSRAPATPTPVRAAPPPTPTAIRFAGGTVPQGYVEPVVVHYVQPRWPESIGVRRIRNSTFLFEALIAQDGRVTDLRTLRTIDIVTAVPRTRDHRSKCPSSVPLCSGDAERSPGASMANDLLPSRVPVKASCRLTPRAVDSLRCATLATDARR